MSQNAIIANCNDCKNIPGLNYNDKYDKFIIDKIINDKRFYKTFKRFNEAVGYLNYLLMKHNLPIIFIKVKEDILND